jgi:hypothetical protein
MLGRNDEIWTLNVYTVLDLLPIRLPLLVGSWSEANEEAELFKLTQIIESLKGLSEYLDEYAQVPVGKTTLERARCGILEIEIYQDWRLPIWAPLLDEVLRPTLLFEEIAVNKIEKSGIIGVGHIPSTLDVSHTG